MSVVSKSKENSGKRVQDLEERVARGELHEDAADAPDVARVFPPRLCPSERKVEAGWEDGWGWGSLGAYQE